MVRADATESCLACASRLCRLSPKRSSMAFMMEDPDKGGDAPKIILGRVHRHSPKLFPQGLVFLLEQRRLCIRKSWGILFFFFLSWRKSARTPGRFWGEAGLQPTKTSTMAVPAVIERDPRNGVSGTPPPPTAQMHPIMERYAVTSYRASSAEPPCKVVWFLYRTAWRSRGADLPVPKFNPHWGARWI